MWYIGVMSKGKLEQLQFSLPVEVFKEGRYFIARTPVLDLAVQGKDEVEVRSRFGEAVVLFFEELVDMGTMNEVLRHLGWVKVKSQWQPPFASIELRPIKVCVPA